MRNKRRDADRIKKLDGLHAIMPHLMPKRTEAEVSMNETFDITELMAYLEKYNKENGTNIKLFHAICYAFARTIYHRPKLNIFISGWSFYQRKDIILSFIVKRKFEDTSEESLMFMKVRPEMTINDVSRKILGDVDTIRKEHGNDMGDKLDFVGKLPRPIVSGIFHGVRALEFFGINPKALTDGDTNYSTLLLSNLGSIGANACYHHLNNYGTNSLMSTIGTMRDENRLKIDGTIETRKVVDIMTTVDERIADGFYFAKSLKITKFLLAHPEHLFERIDDPVPVEL